MAGGLRMTDLSAGEHIIDALEIDRIRESSTRRLAELFRVPNAVYSVPFTELGYIEPDATRWTLNNVPLHELSAAEVERVYGIVERCTTKLEAGLMARHPSSERFHSLLPNVAEMAYRFAYELGLDTASAWAVPEWVIAMRNAEYRLRCLQAAARGERTAKAPTTLMMEVAALAMVAKKYHIADESATWAHDYAAGMGALHDRKQRDYGAEGDPFANVRASEEWGIRAWTGAMVRLNDKVRRLQSFARRGELANESAVDSIEDISVYAIISRVLYEQDQE